MKITKKMMIKFRAFSLTKCRLIICHGAVADVPRGAGRRATAPWQTCQGAVANNFKAFRNRRVPF